MSKSLDRDVLVRVTSSVLKFKLKANTQARPVFKLIADNKPNLYFYEVYIGNRQIQVFDVYEQKVAESSPGNLKLQEFPGFWVTWFNGVVKIGRMSDNKVLIKFRNSNHKMMLKYAKFESKSRGLGPFPVEWIIEVSPIQLKPIEYTKFEGHELKWEPVTKHTVPQDAVVGGFENEPIYIARAIHGGSLCPGKYVRSKGKTFVPWGGREHAKNDFEVLCGLDFGWVKTKCNYIPENAFVAGRSEVQGEPLYIGRATYDGYLLTGKIHTLYETCYLPYNGKEIEVNEFEILVTPSIKSFGVFLDNI